VLDTYVSPPGTGTIGRTPSFPSYSSGTIVDLTANSSPSYQFSSWRGSIVSGSNPAALVMNANKAVFAQFTAMPSAACSDGIDNDGDGCADFPLDLGCTSPSDPSETGGGCQIPPSVPAAPPWVAMILALLMLSSGVIVIRGSRGARP
jgi:hypothetical protein